MADDVSNKAVPCAVQCTLTAPVVVLHKVQGKGELQLRDEVGEEDGRQGV